MLHGLFSEAAFQEDRIGFQTITPHFINCQQAAIFFVFLLNDEPLRPFVLLSGLSNIAAGAKILTEYKKRKRQSRKGLCSCANAMPVPTIAALLPLIVNYACTQGCVHTRMRNTCKVKINCTSAAFCAE